LTDSPITLAPSAPLSPSSHVLRCLGRPRR